MNTELAIQENDLQLVVSEKTLGSLTTNALQIKEIVERNLPRYDIINYNEDNIDDAKKDKAMLNNAAKALNAKRIEFEKEFMKPFSEFKEVVNDTVKLISDCSAKIDVVVKQCEEKAKQEKYNEIKGYFEFQSFTLVPFEKIFEQRWLNKTEKTKTIFAEIDAKIVKINDDIKTIEAIGEDIDLLKSLYLDTLNLNNTIQYANTLKQNREKARIEAEERAKKEAEEKNNDEYSEVVCNSADCIVDSSENFISTQTLQQEPITRAFKVTTTKENIVLLGDFMNERGIKFEKIEP